MKIPAAAAKLAACNVSGENGTTPYQTGGSTLTKVQNTRTCSIYSLTMYKVR